MVARKSPAGITAQAAGDEASELGKQRSKSPGNQCATSTVPIQSLNQPRDRPPCMKSRKNAANSSTAGTIEIPRALTLPATSGTGREIPGDRGQMTIPTPPASETPSSKANKNPPRKPARRKQQKLSQNAGRRRPQVAPRPQDADVLAHAEPLLREGAPGRRTEEERADLDKKRAVGLPPARRAGEEEEGALEEAVSLFSTT